MDMKRFFLYAIVIAALALAGCGGNGGGTQTAMPDPPPPPPATCPDGQVGTPPDCMDPTPPAPTELTAEEMAFVRGIVNPRVADDPTTSRPTSDVSRPGQAASEQLSVTQGMLADTTSTTGAAPPMNKPRTMIGTVNIDGPDSPFKKVGAEGTLGAFLTQSYEKKTRAMTDTVHLFSNIDDPKSEKYLTYYGDGDAVTDAVAAVRPGVRGGTPATGALTLRSRTDATTTDFEKKYADLIGPGVFPTAATATKTYGADADERKVESSFNGVPGEFVCTGDTCAAETKDGKRVDLTGTWTFTPTETDHSLINVPDVKYDADYLSFGYWISETTTASGSRFEVGTVYAGAEPFLNANIAALTGTATYTGEAAGAYARKGDNPAVGEFTGHASLTAKFGDGTEAGTISGTISQLVDDGEAIDPSWSVELQEATIEATDTAATFDGLTPRGGNWEGGFYGGNPTTADATSYPRGVAGEFTGHFENGHVIGAFGATRR